MTQPFSYVWLLPLLERPHESVTADLDNAIAALNIAPPLPEPIALREVLLTALGSDSEYWSRCAARWLEQGFPLDADLCESVLLYASRKMFSQPIRHTLVRLVKRWQRLNDLV
ncbi:hypothetical protein [Pseudomonas sp. Fl4BN1]|uniref:hypothetical protein n=1 Tax=Pseudomonas sp. Fl4BN1 TaxID=2697651 RepID=UPI0013774663|nr:hypothetical protein [Pseudomonas sp. Fl4BN1]NBF10812.1 hypothetical protein [Pseudomonas sp. Fl4BN1]